MFGHLVEAMLLLERERVESFRTQSSIVLEDCFPVALLASEAFPAVLECLQFTLCDSAYLSEGL